MSFFSRHLQLLLHRATQRTSHSSALTTFSATRLLHHSRSLASPNKERRTELPKRQKDGRAGERRRTKRRGVPDSLSAVIGGRLDLHYRIEDLIRSGDLDAACSATRGSFSPETRPTVFTCNVVCDAMLRAGRLDDAISLFEFFFNKSKVHPNTDSYDILIDAHCEAGHVDKAMDVYREVLFSVPFAPSAAAYQRLTKGLVEAGRIQDAVDLLSEMLHRGHGADELVYDNVIKGYIDLDNWDKALELSLSLKSSVWCTTGLRKPGSRRGIGMMGWVRMPWRVTTLCWGAVSSTTGMSDDLGMFLDRRRMILAMLPFGSRLSWVFPKNDNGSGSSYGQIDSLQVRWGIDPVLEEMKKIVVFVEKQGVFHYSWDLEDKKSSLFLMDNKKNKKRQYQSKWGL